MSGPDSDVLARRVSKLPFKLQVAFAAAASEHFLHRAGPQFRERGFDKVTDPALEELWAVARGAPPDEKALLRHEKECMKWAPDTEDEPESGDITFGLLAVAAACALAQGQDAGEELKSLIDNTRFAIAHLPTADDAENHPDSEDDPQAWQRSPAVLEEADYQNRLADKLETLGDDEVHREKLVAP